MAGRHVITIEFNIELDDIHVLTLIALSIFDASNWYMGKNLSFSEMNGNFRFITSHEVWMIFEFSIVTLMFMRDCMDTTTTPSLIHTRKRQWKTL